MAEKHQIVISWDIVLGPDLDENQAIAHAWDEFKHAPKEATYYEIEVFGLPDDEKEST